MWDALTTAEDEYSRLRRENVKLINSYGPPLLKIVCRDACDGPEIGQVSPIILMLISNWCADNMIVHKMTKCKHCLLYIIFKIYD